MPWARIRRISEKVTKWPWADTYGTRVGRCGKKAAERIADAGTTTRRTVRGRNDVGKFNRASAGHSVRTTPGIFGQVGNRARRRVFAITSARAVSAPR